ncbi:MAG TPA: class I SAM-dependent methyltransferase [Verrucomicrobiales bacterium]|jgi:SAM-dependent methyltransferase|nr:class I SAM-dependent methyltransferase [Verrucomicrobiales bacterium]HIL68971.1 class I SAM-dependent methyltransferase [Verrucomicrobiota bacterium]
MKFLNLISNSRIRDVFVPRTTSPFLVIACLIPIAYGVSAQEKGGDKPIYEFKKEHDPDGIGKFYMGREISHVMGHLGAVWLERPERSTEENPDLLIDLLDLKPGMNVADIGVGTGYISRRIAPKISPGGTVFGVDIQPEMLELLAKNMKRLGIDNVKPIRGTVKDLGVVKNSIDLVIMVDVYHEFEYPHEMMQSIIGALKPGGRIAFVEYRGEDPTVPIKELHKMTQAQVKKEAAQFPLEWIETQSKLPRQHVILFRKKL